MNRFFLLCSLAVLTFTNSCKKPAVTVMDNAYCLSNATQTGANIFARRANSEIWIAGNGIYLIGG